MQLNRRASLAAAVAVAAALSVGCHGHASGYGNPLGRHGGHGGGESGSAPQADAPVAIRRAGGGRAMASDATILELILFVLEQGWRLELERKEVIGGHDQFVVTTATTPAAQSDNGEEADNHKGA